MNRIVAVLLAAALALLVAPAPAPAEDYPFQVIVAASNPVSSISREEAGHYFLRKTTRWPGGAPVLPVDQATSSGVREDFSSAILGKSVSAVESYWMQKVFSGAAVPPVKKASDDEVLAYVRANEGAIGYVSKGAALTGVKAVSVK